MDNEWGGISMQTFTRRLCTALVAAGVAIGPSGLGATAHAADDTSWGQVKGGAHASGKVAP